jgi:hypothetical protein
MKVERWFCLLLVMSVAAISFAGDIQVTCEAGLRVYLDGKLVGTSSSKEDGFFLANVPEGPHSIRVEKAGFVPQTFKVELANVPIEVRVGEFAPEPVSSRGKESSSPEAAHSVGDLIVTSAPQNCLVEIDGKPETKETPLLQIDGLAAGEHSISFSKPGYDRISGVVTIQPGPAVTVRGDLVVGKVEIIHQGKGSLCVMSTPEYCVIHFLGKAREKTGAKLRLSFIPAGEHHMVVNWKGRELSTNVLIRKGYRTIVTVSFMRGDEPFVISYERE